MKPQKTRHISRTRRDLSVSTADNAGYAAHLGLGEYYLPAFMLQVGGGQIAAGLVATLPQVVGALLQLVAPLGVSWFHSLKKWVVLCAVIQAASFIPLVIAALIGTIPIGLLFMVAAIYWGAGMAAGPAWSTWMGLIVPPRIRARYFAIRTRVGNVTLLLGLLGAGSLLQMGEMANKPFQAFAIIFLLAGTFRLISAYFLTQHTERTPPTHFKLVSPIKVLRRMRRGHDGALLLYLLTVSLTAWTAAPYFTPYMLQVLNLDYAHYVVLVAAMHSARILALPLMGVLAQRWGADRLMWIGGVAITPMAAIWVLSTDFWALLAFQVLSGVAWAIFELAGLLMTFETIRASERTEALTLFNFANALAMAAGSLIGGAVLGSLTNTDEAYRSLFVLSSILRALSLILLFRIARSPFHPDPEQLPELALRPADSTTFDSIILTIQRDAEGKIVGVKEPGKK